MVLLGIVEAFEQSVSDTVSDGLVSVLLLEIKSSFSERVLDVVDYLLLNGLLVAFYVAAHEFPEFFTHLFVLRVVALKFGSV